MKKTPPSRSATLAPSAFVKAAGDLENAHVQLQAIRATLAAAWLAGGESDFQKAFREKRGQLHFYKAMLSAIKFQVQDQLRRKKLSPETKALLLDMLRIIGAFRAELRSLNHPPLDCLIRDFKAHAGKAIRA